MRIFNLKVQIAKSGWQRERSRLISILGQIIRDWPYQLLMAPYFVAVIYPLFWLICSSLKSNRELFISTWSLPEVLQWGNYARAWRKAGISQYFFNSVLVTGLALTGTIFFGALTAYALARYKFPGSKLIYLFFVAGIMMPMIIGIIPLFFLMKDLGLLNSRVGLILVYVAKNLPFTIFVLHGFFRSPPSELMDAAEVDGCTPIGTFFRVMFPIAREGIIVVAIFDFIAIWNEYMYALVLISDSELRTLPLGVANLYIVGRYHADWTMLLAGLVIVMIPSFVVYIFLQGRFREGITLGAKKG